MENRIEAQHPMSLVVNNFRSIHEADINLDGITVITGENGSGKSTLSRILYNTIKFSQNYELLVAKNLNSKIKKITEALSHLIMELSLYEEDEDRKNNLVSIRRTKRLVLKSEDIESIKEYEEKHYLYLELVYNYAKNLIEESGLPFEEIKDSPLVGRKFPLSRQKSRIDRIYRVFYNTLNEEDEYNNLDFTIVIELIKQKISTSFENAYDYLNARPINIFSDELSSLFHESLHEKFYLVEYGVPITDWSEDRILNTNWIRKSIYIDTPMAIKNNSTNDDYWYDLTDELKESNKDFRKIDSFDEIANIISGEVYYEEDFLSDGFRYKRLDGNVFDIDDCATGIKAFGILQLLLNRGKLTKDTLLIIDEPEAHLHPQWIVEYARVIVLLNKKLGVKFFVATHNPDMVSAIKYIAEKEGVDDGLNFYLAERVDGSYSYNYTALQTDISDIFSSFNISFERINQYSLSDE